MTILMVVDRVAPESKNNSVLFPSLTYTESINERNIVMSTEQFVPINGYEGIYEISNLGNVKSLERKVRCRGGFRTIAPSYLNNQRLNSSGYPIVRLYKGRQGKSFYIHQLVWTYFGNGVSNGRKLHIDHIDNNKTNNRIENLQLLTSRENTSKGFKVKGTTSKYTGVSYYNYKKTPRWRAGIGISGKSVTIGYFDNEYDAHLAYQKALENV